MWGGLSERESRPLLTAGQWRHGSPTVFLNLFDLAIHQAEEKRFGRATKLVKRRRHLFWRPLGFQQRIDVVAEASRRARNPRLP